MRSFMTLAALCGAALALSACNTTTSAQLLNNLSADCERHYDGAIGGSLTGGSFQGTVKIDCTPATKATTTPAVSGAGVAAAPAG